MQPPQNLISRPASGPSSPESVRRHNLLYQKTVLHIATERLYLYKLILEAPPRSPTPPWLNEMYGMSNDYERPDWTPTPESQRVSSRTPDRTIYPGFPNYVSPSPTRADTQKQTRSKVQKAAPKTKRSTPRRAAPPQTRAATAQNGILTRSRRRPGMTLFELDSKGKAVPSQR